MFNPKPKNNIDQEKIQEIKARKRFDKSLLNDNTISKFSFVKKPELKVISTVRHPLPKPEPKHTNVVFMPQTPRYFSGKNGTFKHSGDIGDLVYSLPVLRSFGGGTLYLNPNGLPTRKGDGTRSGFDYNQIEFLSSLLKEQFYIKNVLPWHGEKVDIDIDYFRTPGNDVFNLCEKILSAFGVSFSETNTPWITCDEKNIAKCVIARSFRYRNPKMNYTQFLEQFGDQAVFVGLSDEHEDFEKKFGKIRFYQVSSFLEMAQIINGSELFVGNQSSPMALAIAMHKPFIQECFPSHADCVFDFQNARYFK